MSTATTPTRPLLRYFGGKWQLRHWIIEHLPAHQFYAEPFAGAASVLLAKRPAPKEELINDLNRDVVNLFRVMQHPKRYRELVRRLSWTPYASQELEIAREDSDEPVERARRLVVRSFMGIEVAGVKAKRTGFRMGNVDLRRVDRDGLRTFRNCAADWSNWKESLPLIRARLEKVMIYERDALEFIELMDTPGCLLYVDPPYQHDTRSETRYAVEFEAERHDVLLKRLMACKAMVVLSGYPHASYDEPLAAANWKRVEKESRANMMKENDTRTEVLWINPAASRGTDLFGCGVALSEANGGIL